MPVRQLTRFSHPAFGAGPTRQGWQTVAGGRFGAAGGNDHRIRGPCPLHPSGMPEPRSIGQIQAVVPSGARQSRNCSGTPSRYETSSVRGGMEMDGTTTALAAPRAANWEKRIAAKRRKRAICFALLVPFRGYFIVFYPPDSSVLRASTRRRKNAECRNDRQHRPKPP